MDKVFWRHHGWRVKILVLRRAQEQFAPGAQQTIGCQWWRWGLVQLLLLWRRLVELLLRRWRGLIHLLLLLWRRWLVELLLLLLWWWLVELLLLRGLLGLLLEVGSC